MSQTVTPRNFATRRICFSLVEYEKLANLIKKYGCPVSKVSDMFSPEGDYITTIYFDIPLAVKEQFLSSEKE